MDNCDGFHKVSSGDQCDTIASKYGISVAQLKDWNTEIDDSTYSAPKAQLGNPLTCPFIDCSNLWLGYYVCIHVPGTITTSAGSSTPSDTSSGPTPQMPGIIASCKTYYQVKSGDSCYSIYTAAGITLSNFLLWNTEVNSSCSNLWLGYYVCTGV